MRYADLSDITAFGRSLSEQESEKADVLIEAASAKLRILAADNGVDIDALTADEKLGADYRIAIKSVVVQAVIRAFDSMASQPLVSQNSQSALGYSASVTYFNPGQSIYFLKSELKDLGFFTQKFSFLEVYGNGTDKGN